MKHPFPPWLGRFICAAMFCGASTTAMAVQISFPANFPAVRGNQIDIPITIGNVTGLNVYSYELKFSFDPNVLTVVDVLEAGTLTSSWSANEFHEINGVNLRIVAAGSTPLSGSGTLLNIRFNLPLSGSGSSYLTWIPSQCRLNEGTPSLTFVDGLVSVTNPPTLVFNPNSATFFAGDSVAVSVSGGTSPYTFSVLQPSVGAFDQFLPSSGYFRGITMGTTQLQATDANTISKLSGNFVVRPIKLIIPDSTVISGHTFLMPVKILVAGGVPPSEPQALVAATAPGGPPLHPRLYWQEQSGLSYDIHRSGVSPFVPGGPGVTEIPVVTDELPGDPTLFRYTDNSLDLSASSPAFYLVTAEGAGALSVFSGQMRISWTSSFLNLAGIVLTGTLLQNWSFQSEPHSAYVDVSFSHNQPLAGSGTLFYLQLTVIPGSSSTNLTMTNVLFNEDLLAVLDDGSVSRIPPPTIVVSPGSAFETVVGDSVQFSVAGGTAPYTWHLSNGSTGTISPTGKFMANSGGLTYVWAQDVNSFTDSSGLITVNDFRLQPQSLTAARGDSATISLQLIGNATGLGVYASDITVTIQSGGFVFAYPITTGTLMNGWLTASEANGSTIHVAASSGIPLTGSGVLMQLRGRVPIAAATGALTITINTATLNEGNRRALRLTGTLTVIP